jgi:uncharacterized LabA/DUF88 family protein
MCFGLLENIQKDKSEQKENLPMFYKTDKIALLVDGIHIHGITKDLDFQIDFKKMRSEFANRSILTRASYYTTVMENDDYCPMQPLIDWLGYNGYTLRTKPTRTYNDEMGNKKVKRSMLIEMAVDAMEISNHVDHIVIFSGDGDLKALVEAVQRNGTRVSICSTTQTATPVVSDDLRRQADNFIDIDNLRRTIARSTPKFEGNTD